jgi:hypothetical protein
VPSGKKTSSSIISCQPTPNKNHSRIILKNYISISFTKKEREKRPQPLNQKAQFSEGSRGSSNLERHLRQHEPCAYCGGRDAVILTEFDRVNRTRRNCIRWPESLVPRQHGEENAFAHNTSPLKMHILHYYLSGLVYISMIQRNNESCGTI